MTPSPALGAKCDRLRPSGAIIYQIYLKEQWILTEKLLFDSVEQVFSSYQAPAWRQFIINLLILLIYPSITFKFREKHTNNITIHCKIDSQNEL